MKGRPTARSLEAKIMKSANEIQEKIEILDGVSNEERIDIQYPQSLTSDSTLKLNEREILLKQLKNWANTRSESFFAFDQPLLSLYEDNRTLDDAVVDKEIPKVQDEISKTSKSTQNVKTRLADITTATIAAANVVCESESDENPLPPQYSVPFKDAERPVKDFEEEKMKLKKKEREYLEIIRNMRKRMAEVEQDTVKHNEKLNQLAKHREDLMKQIEDLNRPLSPIQIAVSSSFTSSNSTESEERECMTPIVNSSNGRQLSLSENHFFIPPTLDYSYVDDLNDG